MSDAEFLRHYSGLLRTRRRAARTATVITRWLFLLVMIGFFAAGVLGYLAGPAFFIVAIVFVESGVAHAMAWTRLHTVESTLEFVEALYARTG